MYQLTIETQAGLKTSLQIENEVAQLLNMNGFPRSATPREKVLSEFVECAKKLSLGTAFISIKEWLVWILNDSNSEFFTIQLEAIPAVQATEKIDLTSLFKDARITPEPGKEILINTVTGQLVSPALYDSFFKRYRIPVGEVRPYMIKSWAYLDDVNQVLNLTALEDKELLAQLEKQAKEEQKQSKEGSSLSEVLKEILNMGGAELFKSETKH